MRYLAEHDARPAFFPELVARIPDVNDHIRFFALTALVKHYSTLMQAHAAQLAPLLMERLLDANSPVADRAIWGLNIVGETALPHLLAATEAPEWRERLMAAFALGRNHQMSVATEPALAALLRLLDDENEQVQSAALGIIMDLTPLRPFRRIEGVDFEPIYQRLLPLAEHFSQHLDAHYQEWGNRYRQLLINR
ncbi:HEAT repeat domain-containing protein [Hymenobacter sp. CRA2]|uniref:HEAT repeat domain-containing protein n=1 Tax=Hymenobacter sp. CRA2 TaxID=1955620 RepID=UPI0015904B83|nr:hypothetical protein [Hymenobacter sp. CRA2]